VNQVRTGLLAGAAVHVRLPWCTHEPQTDDAEARLAAEDSEALLGHSKHVGLCRLPGEHGNRRESMGIGGRAWE
jgi:hypothetical protein